MKHTEELHLNITEIVNSTVLMNWPKVYDSVRVFDDELWFILHNSLKFSSCLRQKALKSFFCCRNTEKPDGLKSLERTCKDKKRSKGQD